ncbi:hypothetical protein EXE43_05380 [Halorubrum sp. SS5]|nr:hypothetical protein EXE43_05380 [Halorubrum sp. SS5]
MVVDRLDDGVRIAQLLASEVTGNESGLRGLTVADADRDVEPTPDGALAYRIAREAGEPVVEVYVQPDRARIEALAAPDAVADAAAAAGLRVRPKAVRPPRTLVFVEDGAAVKRALAVLEALRTGSDAE